jgi:hypothetical protein
LPDGRITIAEIGKETGERGPKLKSAYAFIKKAARKPRISEGEVVRLGIEALALLER